MEEHLGKLGLESGYGSKLNHQELDRRFLCMFPLTRETHLGNLFLTHSPLGVGQRVVYHRSGLLALG